MGSPLNQLAREIVRQPDTADLLLALACAPHTVAGQALDELDVDRDALWASIEKVRPPRRRALAHASDDARLKKQRAIGTKQSELAAQARDAERELSQQLRAEQQRQRQAREDPANATSVLAEIRRRMGLPDPSSCTSG